VRKDLSGRAIGGKDLATPRFSPHPSSLGPLSEQPEKDNEQSSAVEKYVDAESRGEVEWVEGEPT
jgi:hypothetical protein